MKHYKKSLSFIICLCLSLCLCLCLSLSLSLSLLSMSLSTLSLCILYICYRGAGDQHLVRLEQEQVVPPEFRTTDGDIAALQIQQGTLQVCSYFFSGMRIRHFFPRIGSGSGSAEKNSGSESDSGSDL